MSGSDDTTGVEARRATTADSEARRELFALRTTSFVLVLGQSLVTPVLPLYTDELGVSAAGIGLVIGGYGIGQILSSFLAPPCAQRFGFRATAMTAGLLTGITAFLASFSGSFLVMLVLRLLQGAGTGLYITAAMNRLLDVTPAERIGRMLSSYQGSLLVGVSAGPIIGGWTAQVWGLRAPFLVWGSVCVVTTLAASVTFRKHVVTAHGLLTDGAGADAADAAKKVTQRSQIRALARDPIFRRAMAVTLVIYWARQGYRATAAPLVAAEEYHMNAGLIGTVMMLATLTNAATLPHAGRLIDRRGARPVIVLGTVTTVICVGFLALVVNAWMVVVAAVAIGISTGYGVIGSASEVGAAPAAIRPVTVSAQRFIANIGQALGPIGVGVLIDLLGFRGASLVGAGLVGVIGLVAYSRSGGRPRRSAAGTTADSSDPPGFIDLAT